MGAWAPATRQVGWRGHCVQGREPGSDRGVCGRGAREQGSLEGGGLEGAPARAGPARERPVCGPRRRSRRAVLRVEPRWEPRGAAGPLARSSRPSNLNHAGSQPLHGRRPEGRGEGTGPRGWGAGGPLGARGPGAAEPGDPGGPLPGVGAAGED